MPSWFLLWCCFLCCCTNITGSISDIEIPLVVNSDVARKDEQSINTDTDSSSDSCDDSCKDYKLLRALNSLKKQPEKSVLSPSNKTRKGWHRVAFNETLNVRAYKYQRFMEDITAPLQEVHVDTVTSDTMTSLQDIQPQITCDKMFYCQVAGVSITAVMAVLLFGYAALLHRHYVQKL